MTYLPFYLERRRENDPKKYPKDISEVLGITDHLTRSRLIVCATGLAPLLGCLVLSMISSDKENQYHLIYCKHKTY